MRSTDEKVGGRSVTAFAPGHLTGVFEPAIEAADPRARGSLGAGVALEVGAWAQARWTPGRSRRVSVGGDLGAPWPISRDVAERLVADRRGTLRVDLRHELPIGQGFGMSAAGALATGLAVAGALGVPAQRAIETAHLAELFGGGGQGGVAAILRPGLERRDRPGIPPWGRISHRPWSGRIFLVVMGAPIPSPTLLHDPEFLDRVGRSGHDGLRALRRGWSAERLFEEAEAFTDRLGLAPPSWGRIVRRLRGAETRVAQAMLGRSLFAVAFTPEAERRLITKLGRVPRTVIRVRGGHVGAGVVHDRPSSERGPKGLRRELSAHRHGRFAGDAT
ncbi:MAG TPA: hypothetical protein VGV89_07815 [Thermoplasmata archaeon]|nr:hypothetical protein [Thermoplasmata archaeon]